MRKGPFRGEAISTQHASLFWKGLDDPERWFAEGGETIKSGASSVVKIVPVSQGQSLVVKRFGSGIVRHWVTGVLGMHRARRNWIVSSRLHAAGVPVPMPWGYLYGYRAGVGAVGFFLSEAVENVTSLYWTTNRTPELSDWFRKNSLLPNIGRALAAIHDCEIVHGDFKWSNILIDPGATRFWIIDFDGSKMGRSPGGEVKDVLRFVTSCRKAKLPELLTDDFVSCYLEARSKNDPKREGRIRAAQR